MQNPQLKFRQSTITSKKPGFFSGKLWRDPTTTEFNIFCWNFAHLFYLPVFIKRCSGFFILFRSCVVDRPGFCEWVEIRSFYFGE